MSPMKTPIASTCLLLLSVCLLGVFKSAEADERSASEMNLPVSLNEVMVAMVNNSADPIWQAAWRHPESDEVWRSLERNAYQLEIAGALLGRTGYGPNGQGLGPVIPNGGLTVSSWRIRPPGPGSLSSIATWKRSR